MISLLVIYNINYNVVKEVKRNYSLIFLVLRRYLFTNDNMRKMAMMMQLMIIAVLLTSCNNVLLKQYRKKEFVIDTQGDTYKSLEM